MAQGEHERALMFRMIGDHYGIALCLEWLGELAAEGQR